MRVLVTGSSGRLGLYVVSELEQAGHDLVLFSRRAPAPELGQKSKGAGKWNHLVSSQLH